ncbi:MAG: hypothetical protein CW338_03395 [Clostridiales bacterium]|nr:hypothetical protein [Clostridiales bacterium]
MTVDVMKHTKNRKTAFVLVTVIATVLLALALLLFTVQNNRRITAQNREYLLDNARQMAASVDSAITDGHNNIRILSALAEQSMTGPEFDIASMQGLIKDSVFDFMEYADPEGMDHNITGGVSEAKDRKYYTDARNGNRGMELIHISRATHETLLMFYSPILYEGRFAGSLVGVYQASNRITHLIRTEYFGEAADTYLAAENGLVIAGSRGYDPADGMYITALAGDDGALASLLTPDPAQDQPISFSLPGNATGGCMIRLPESGYYLVQIFPQAAGRRMTNDANLAGYVLTLFLLLLYAAVLTALILSYRRQQRQVEEARNQAEIASQAKTSFLFNMSHDIRTPMNAILGYTNIGLRHVEDVERSRDSYQKIKTAGGHLLNLINDILEMSRIESGTLVLAENPVDVLKAIENIDQMSQALAIPREISFETKIGEIRDAYVYADELHINEVIINLISNAIKYTDAGGNVTYSVCQTGEAAEGWAAYRFEVSDDGIGMSEEFQSRLFEAFSRENSATVSKTEGAGLGLSIVKRIVDMAGGTISVRSTPGKGSVFTVEIPFRVMDEEAVAKLKTEDASAETIVSDTDLTGKRILLVEDNEMNREIATELLTEAGLDVETAEDGEIAVRMIIENGADRYDFILMDIQMPVMNGYEAAKTIRMLPSGQDVPIIALSANAFAEDKAASLAAGMNDHVAKPVNIRELLGTLAKYA